MLSHIFDFKSKQNLQLKLQKKRIERNSHFSQKKNKESLAQMYYDEMFNSQNHSNSIVLDLVTQF